MMLMMGFWLIVPFLLIAAGVSALGGQPQLNQTRPAQTSQTPLEIVKERYARGEITQAEYDQVRRDLEG